jgi:hypothetical protein
METQLAHIRTDREESAFYKELDRYNTEATSRLCRKTGRQLTHVQQIAFIALLSERAPPCRVDRSDGGKAKGLLVVLFKHALHRFGTLFSMALVVLPFGTSSLQISVFVHLSVQGHNSRKDVPQKRRIQSKGSKTVT